MDFNLPNQMLVAAGYSTDFLLRGETSNYLPTAMIAYYQGTDLTEVWVKWMANSTAFLGVSISLDGTVIVAVSSPYIVTFSMAGNVINSFQYSLDNFMVETSSRFIAVVSNSKAYFAYKNTASSGGVNFIKFNPSIF